MGRVLLNGVVREGFSEEVTPELRSMWPERAGE